MKNDFQKAEEKKLRSFFLLGWHFKWIIKYNLLVNISVFINNFMV